MFQVYPHPFCRTLPTKFHPKFRPSFSRVTVDSDLFTGQCHPIFIQFSSIHGFNVSKLRQCHPSFIQVFQCIVFLLSICSKILLDKHHPSSSKFHSYFNWLCIRDLCWTTMPSKVSSHTLLHVNLNRDFSSMFIVLDDADSSIYLLA